MFGKAKSIPGYAILEALKSGQEIVGFVEDQDGRVSPLVRTTEPKDLVICREALELGQVMVNVGNVLLGFLSDMPVIQGRAPKVLEPLSD